VSDGLSIGRRVLRFNAVGLIGWGVQAAVLWSFVQAGMPALPAVIIAVLAAAAHNFVWHERFTWPGRPRGERRQRAALFMLTNGIAPAAANTCITAAILPIAGGHVVLANLLAVLVMAAANYTISDRLVFRRRRAPSAAGASTLPGKTP
jgi:putative flippase GtrA